MMEQHLPNEFVIRVLPHEHCCSWYLDQLGGDNQQIEKVVIYLEVGAQAKIYDIRAGKRTRSVQIFLADEAQLSYVYDRQTKADTTTHQDVTHLNVTLHKKSFFQSMVTITGGQLTQFNLTIHLLDSEARAHVGGFYRLEHHQQCIIKTMQHHERGCNISTVSLYGIVEDHASVDYCGLIAIEYDAPRSNAEQVNKSILIGQHARAKSVPTLEVQTNDVQCKHGTATGQLDEEQLFYLQSRGILSDQAQKLLIKAFLLQASSRLTKEMQFEMYKRIDSSMTK